MAIGKLDERHHLPANGVKRAAHRGDGIAPTLKPAALAVNGSELFDRKTRGTAVVMAGLVASEDEDLPFRQFLDPGGSDAGEGLLFGEEIFP